LFRASALRQVAGFEERLRKAGEDVDISWRLRRSGWEVHFVDSVIGRSIQDDSIPQLARSEYNRFVWKSESGNGFARGAALVTARAASRGAAHLVRGRYGLLPVEFAVWWECIRLAWRMR
jgi:cellulose synthase/poly-beta-1,6-N-acetylglucosamine synthase-like glycosyltransferase